MARDSGIRRLCVRWTICICVLCASITSFGATRQNVSIPSGSTITSTGTAAKGTGVVSVSVHEGEYIAANNLNKRVPVKVIKTIDYSIPRTINHVKTGLRANLANLVVGGVIAGMVTGLDWVMGEGGKITKKESSLDGNPVSNAGSSFGPDQYCSVYGASALGKITIVNNNGSTYAVVAAPFKEFQSTWLPQGYTQHLSSCVGTPTFMWDENGMWPRSGAKLISVSDIKSNEAPLTEADISRIDGYVSGQGADWLRDLIRESCEGSPNPAGCYASLQEQTRTSGPAIVQGGTTTTTGTYTKPDGVTGTTSTVTNTNFNINYGPSYFDFTENKTVTTYKDGEKTGEETTTDGDEVTDETPSDDDKENAAPCVTGCDGPAYKDLYQPTNKTKEDEIDSYSSRVKNIPIMKAVIGLFDVDAGSTACPVWESHYQLEVWGHSSQVDLVFDYHCLPWFVDLRVFVQTIVMIGFVYIAIRIGLL